MRTAVLSVIVAIVLNEAIAMRRRLISNFAVSTEICVILRNRILRFAVCGRHFLQQAIVGRSSLRCTTGAPPQGLHGLQAPHGLQPFFAAQELHAPQPFLAAQGIEYRVHLGNGG